MEFLLLAVVISKILNCYAKDEILELVTRSGYIGSFHEIETEDDYIIGVHRIRSRNSTSKKFPVFLMHGFMTTPMSFLITGKKNSLPFILADNNYDVFLGSRRGTKFATKHKKLSTESKEYWNFDWHEIGFYDLKAIIDFTLKTTNKSKCFYVGYSQANTELLVLLSSRPEYNNKLIQAHMMSCATALPNVHELGQLLSPVIINYAQSNRDLMYINMESLIPLQMELAKMLCNSVRPLRVELCKNIIFFMVGRNRRSTEINPATYVTMFKYLSPKIGVKQLLHFAQIIMSSKFRQYDYGADRNLRIYNSTIPPGYHLENVNVPLYFYVGEEDSIFNRKDSEFLAKSLKNVAYYKMIPNYNHFDFIYGQNSHKLLYKDILRFFENIQNDV
ncbi:hypothetical protein ACKWTF_000921 [Chironomus riparius]